MGVWMRGEIGREALARRKEYFDTEKCEKSSHELIQIILNWRKVFLHRRNIYDTRKRHEPDGDNTCHHHTIESLCEKWSIGIDHLSEDGEEKECCFWIESIGNKSFAKSSKGTRVRYFFDGFNRLFFCSEKLIRYIEKINCSESFYDRKYNDRLRYNESNSSDTIGNMDKYSTSHSESCSPSEFLGFHSVLEHYDHIWTRRDSCEERNRSKDKNFRHSKKGKKIQFYTNVSKLVKCVVHRPFIIWRNRFMQVSQTPPPYALPQQVQLGRRYQRHIMKMWMRGEIGWEAYDYFIIFPNCNFISEISALLFVRV